jgi:transposase
MCTSWDSVRRFRAPATPKPSRRYNASSKKTADYATVWLAEPAHRLFFFDEGRFGLHTEHGRLWALQGIRPVAPTAIGYQNFYIYGAVSPVDGQIFSLFLPWANTEMMNLYLAHFSEAYPRHRVTLVLDRAAWHCSDTLHIPGNLELIHLPPYSPELNPAEKLWQWLRRHVTRNRLFSSDRQLEDALQTALRQQTDHQRKSLCRCSYLSGIN